MQQRLTSLKPFLFTAYYEWMLENEITPHLLVDATLPKVKVPQDYVKNGSIILSLIPTAIADFKCQHNGISFKARFKGVSEDIFIPFTAMEQLIALESGSALPIGKVLEQLDLSPEPEEGDIYPDEGLESDGPDFELDEDENSDDEDYLFETEEDDADDEIADTSDEEESENEKKQNKKDVGFSFVDDE